MEAKFNIPSPIQEIKDVLYASKELEVFVKRDDLIDAVISGNKWRKLKHNFQEAFNQKKQTILTFGGAYSNHIAATSEAAKRYGLRSIGIIRGDELNYKSNSTLSRANANGMQLVFISREEYALRNDSRFLQEIFERYHKPFIIPEGGANRLGVLGCSEIYDELEEHFDYICLSSGTGTTAAGMLKVIKDENLIVFPALKGANFLENAILRLSEINQSEQLHLNLDYHFGGYGKINQELLNYMNDFKKKHKIELDRVYTSKLFYGVEALMKKDFFPAKSRVLLIHTGGLQGNSSH